MFIPPYSRTTLRRTIAAWVSLCLGSTDAFAAGSCRVELFGEHAEAWAEATRLLEASLATRKDPTDCARIYVHIDGDRGVVVFWTKDGRSASRELENPTELAATVSALDTASSVIDDRSEAVPPPPDSSSMQRLPSERERPSAPIDVRTGESMSRPSVVGGALAGGRVGAGGLATPILDLYAALNLDDWQIGVLGRGEPYYVNVAERDAQPRSAGLGAGVMAARRVPLGANVLLLAGASAVIAAVHEDRSRKGAGSNTTHADGRLGAYLGLVLPRRATTRLRTNLTFEMMPPRAVERSAEGLALSPWWGVALLVGVELGGP